ncbi:MAG: hypothetical protein ACRDZU_00595 [Acidimicrobiales bacterium]
MEKLIYGLWRRPDQDVDVVRKALLAEVAPALLALEVDGLRIEVEEPAGKILRTGANPDGSLLCGSVSIWLDSYDHRAPHEAAIAKAGTQAHGWIVAESVSKAYGANRTWPDGDVSPGMSILTFLDKGEDVSDEDFYRIWHGEHTPLTFEMHPFWLYVRNQALRPVTPGAPSVRGIVYEAVATDEELLELPRLFGCADEPKRLMDQIARIDAHIATFANPATLQCVTTREWIIKTLST